MPAQKGILKRFRDWIKRQLIEDVPTGIAFCEFDCRKGQCRSGEWDTCIRRLNTGAGQYTQNAERSRKER